MAEEIPERKFKTIARIEEEITEELAATVGKLNRLIDKAAVYDLIIGLHPRNATQQGDRVVKHHIDTSVFKFLGTTKPVHPPPRTNDNSYTDGYDD